MAEFGRAGSWGKPFFRLTASSQLSSSIELITLLADQDWLHKATKEISKYWRHKRERRMNPMPLSRPSKLEADEV